MQQTSSLTIKEDKQVMEQIKKLSANKPMIKQYDEAQESLKGVREHHNNLYTQLKAKNAELSALKEVEEKHRAEMDAARAKEDVRLPSALIPYALTPPVTPPPFPLHHL